MANRHRIIILRENRKGAANAWIHRHSDLDRLNGGNRTFTVKVALLSDPDDGSVIRGRICSWKMTTRLKNILLDRFRANGWKFNKTDNNNDVSAYNADNWTTAQVLADTTRKPRALKIVPVNQEI